MKIIYLSGPMAGRPDLNEPAFRRAAKAISQHPNQLDVIVPHDIEAPSHEGDCPASYAKNGPHSAACYLRADLAVMLVADAVVMMPGWEASVGARLELSVAAACGIPVTMLDPAVLDD
jgi:hypothetical protein